MEEELPMIRQIIGERKAAVERDPNLILVERWDHSDVFYEARKRFDERGYDVNIYGDDPQRRKKFYAKIKQVCEDDFNVKRHQIGIFPQDRAQMAFKGRIYSVGFENIRQLMHNGIVVIVVEKEGTVIKMVPFTESLGVAFIQSQGFVSEYGIALARIVVGGNECHYYTDGYIPHIGNLGLLTDCDASGIILGLKIKNARRLGIGLDTLEELNRMNPGLGLTFEDLEESCSTSTHWKGLSDLLAGNGRKKNAMTYSWSKEEMSYYIPYLWKEYDNVPFIDYLKNKRIELNTILTAVKPEIFWNWLKKKILDTWPYVDYNRAVYTPTKVLTPIQQNFITMLENNSEPLLKNKYDAIVRRLSHTKTFSIEDTDKKADKIKSSMQKTLSKVEQIKGIDQALKQFAIDHNLAKA